MKGYTMTFTVWDVRRHLTKQKAYNAMGIIRNYTQPINPKAQVKEYVLRDAIVNIRALLVDESTTDFRFKRYAELYDVLKIIEAGK